MGSEHVLPETSSSPLHTRAGLHVSEPFESITAVRSVFSSCAVLRTANTTPWVPKYETHAFVPDLWQNAA